MSAVPAPLFDRIRACPSLTPSERVVAGFYEDTYPGAALLRLDEVSAAAGVSTATVTRFARKIGYRDFRELHRELQSEVRARLDAPRRRLARAQETARGAASRTAADASTSDIDARFAIATADLRATAARLDRSSFDRVVELLADDTRPLLLGAVASGQPLIDYFGLLLRYLRGGVTVLGGVDRWAHALAGLPADAVVVAAAFDRYPVPVQRLLRFARAKGATTVLLTNRRSSPLTAEADHCLFVESHADPVFRSRVGLVFVFEALLDAVARRATSASDRATDVERFFALMGGYLPAEPAGTD